jgi:hypothetical protein
VIRIAVALSLLAAGTTPAFPQDRSGIGVAELPGGVAGIQRALGDRLPFDRALVVSEIARRFYNTPVEAADSQDASFARLRRWLTAVGPLAAAQDALDPHQQGFRRTDVSGAAKREALAAWAGALGFAVAADGTLAPADGDGPATRAALVMGGIDPLDAAERFNAREPVPPLRGETIPLPFDDRFWRDVVFEGRVSGRALAPAILADRRAALLHTAFVALDGPVRDAIAGAPDVVRRMDGRAAGALAIAAPWMRLSGGRWTLPGGPRADPAWTSLAGTPPGDRLGFLAAVARQDEGRLAVLVEFLSWLPPPHVDALLSLGSEAEAPRVDALRRLRDAIRAGSPAWSPGARPFWRPLIDPLLLVRQLGVGADGRVALPGTRAFWERIFERRDVAAAAARTPGDGPRPTLHWLIERVSEGTAVQRRTRYEQILYASRNFAAGADESSALAALEGYARFPQLLRDLERLGPVDAGIAAEAVRAATALDAIGDDGRRAVALAQWQGALAVLVRIARADRLTPDGMSAALREWAAVRPDDDGRLRGAVVRWALGRAAGAGGPAASAAGPSDAFFSQLVPRDGVERRVSWENTSYRVDHAAAERFRLDRVRGHGAPRTLDAAADALAVGTPPGSAAAPGSPDLDVAAALDRIARTAGLPEGRDGLDPITGAASSALERTRQSQGARQRESALDLADALGAMALAEAAYASALGSGEELPLRSRDAARRHAFGPPRKFETPRDHAWLPPRVVNDRRTAWHVSGSLLGLDVGLAHLSLRRATRRPPPRAPLLNDGDRDVLAATVVLIDRRRLTPESQAAVRTAVARGRRDVTAARTEADAASLAARAPTGALRRQLAPWVHAHDAASWPGYFSLLELVALGLERGRSPGMLLGWGNSDEPMTGRLAAAALPDTAWELHAGRLSSGLLASAVPDLQIRLADLLGELDLPADLLPDVLSSAVLAFVNGVPSRHPDDWRALVLTAAAVGPQDLERSLALLTTQGALQVAPGATSGR